MAIPWGLILSGGSALAGLIGGSRKRPKFRFEPEENDPEYLLRRRRALEEIGRDRSRTLNEINRAGLLGAGPAYGILGEQEARGARMLEDVSADSLARQRQEQLAMYMDEQNFNDRSRLMSLESLGGIGESIPYFLGQGDNIGFQPDIFSGADTTNYRYLNPSRRRDMLARYDRYGGIY